MEAFFSIRSFLFFAKVHSSDPQCNEVPLLLSLFSLSSFRNMSMVILRCPLSCHIQLSEMLVREVSSAFYCAKVHSKKYMQRRGGKEQVNQFMREKKELQRTLLPFRS